MLGQLAAPQSKLFCATEVLLFFGRALDEVISVVHRVTACDNPRWSRSQQCLVMVCHQLCSCYLHNDPVIQWQGMCANDHGLYLAGVQVQLAGAKGPPITVELGPHGTLQKLKTSVAKAFKHLLGGKVGFGA